MAWAKYSSWRSGRRSRSSRRWYSGVRRRATGNARAARQQRDSATVTISRFASVPVVIPVGSSGATTILNHWDNLRLSEFFTHYAAMYDQMRIDKIKLKLTGSQGGSAQTINISPNVVLAFDRNGLDPSQVVDVTNISTYSSAQLKTWSVGNAFSMYQTIYPFTIMEKGQYIPTNSLRDPGTDATASNPCTNLTFSALPFKPISLLGVSVGFNTEAANTFSFTGEFEYTVTFRGMRKPTAAYVAPVDVSFTHFYLFTSTSTGSYREYELNSKVLLSDFTKASTASVAVPARCLLIKMTLDSNQIIDYSQRVLFSTTYYGSNTSALLSSNTYYYITPALPDDVAFTYQGLGTEDDFLIATNELGTRIPGSVTSSISIQEEDIPDLQFN